MWRGTVDDGTGNIALGSGALVVPYSLRSRIKDGDPHTNPEELIGAAHAGCFSMSLSSLLTDEGFPPSQVCATAVVTLEQLEDRFSITQIDLDVVGDVPGLGEARFVEFAERAKATCPVSRALTGTSIALSARLEASRAVS
jgi:osmotically inducible protein OsmC